MSGVTTETDRLKITKANKLVEITLIETNTRLSLRDQKVILAVVGQISPDDKDFSDYRISIAELVKLTGISDENLYRDIRTICSRLMSSVITIKEPDNPDGFLMVTWFSHARYRASEGEVEFSISPELKPYLLQLKEQFTTYHLNQVINLQSTYSIRLYELLRQFLPLKAVQKGRASSFRDLSLNDLRGYLGVASGKYPKFFDFRRYVLEKAQVELEDKTDLSFDFEPVRKGRKISSIRFIIRHNIKLEEVEADELHGDLMIPLDTTKLDEYVSNAICSQLPDMSEEELSLIAELYPRDIILEALFDLMRVMSSGAIRNNPVDYYHGILKNKQKEAQMSEKKSVKSTEEKLTDRSWAEGLDLEN